MNFEESQPRWVPLAPAERRVLGVLIEKQKTTPEYYPMTLSAIASACNQKSNRDPITSYDVDDVEEILQLLRQKGVALMVEGGGRVTKWKHNAYEWLELKGKPREAAVLAELLLRGPQTEGELRTRASRMDEIADLSTLQEILGGLAARGLVVYLSPPGQKRGVMLTHGLYPPDELDLVRQEVTRGAPTAAATIAHASVRPPAWEAEASAIRAEIQALHSQLAELRGQFDALKRSLGAD